MEKDPWVFLVSDYYATGEGRTVCLMMTRALPSCKEDIQIDGNILVPCNSQEHRARHQFSQEFGPWYSLGVELLSRDKFFETYEKYLPEKIKDLAGRSCCGLEYVSRLHFNLS